MDVGQPKDYLAGQCKYLTHVQHHQPELLVSGGHIKGPVIIVCA
jgi:hypothetical protein